MLSSALPDKPHIYIPSILQTISGITMTTNQIMYIFIRTRLPRNLLRMTDPLILVVLIVARRLSVPLCLVANAHSGASRAFGAVTQSPANIVHCPKIPRQRDKG